MVSLQAVYLCPVLSVHLLKFIEVAFRLGDVLNSDVVTFGRERQVGRLVCNSAPHRRRRRPRSFGAYIQARLLHFGHDSGWYSDWNSYHSYSTVLNVDQRVERSLPLTHRQQSPRTNIAIVPTGLLDLVCATAG